MKRIILLVCLFLAACTIQIGPIEEMPVLLDAQPLNINNSITIANWNLQIYGQKKASNESLLNLYAEKIDDFDIIFIQEIRDVSQTAFPKLCSKLPDYNCRNSSRAGRSSSKEQYGIIYKKDITLTNIKDFNPNDNWERPPVKVTFSKNNYQFTVYNIHTKPDDVQNELAQLQAVVTNQGNEIIIGDLNADCSYYNNKKETEFDTWKWIIKDHHDTTVAKSDCAYDRIILNNDAYDDAIAAGINRKGIVKGVSDHYLIWLQLVLE